MKKIIILKLLFATFSVSSHAVKIDNKFNKDLEANIGGYRKGHVFMRERFPVECCSLTEVNILETMKKNQRQLKETGGTSVRYSISLWERESPYKEVVDDFTLGVLKEETTAELLEEINNKIIHIDEKGDSPQETAKQMILDKRNEKETFPELLKGENNPDDFDISDWCIIDPKGCLHENN